MRRCSVLILCVLLTFFAFLGSTSEFISSHQKSVVGRNFNGVNRAPARRSLLSDSKQADTAIVAALDGTIYLLDLNSYKPIWSFSSGPTIYSSYQALVNVHNDKENSSGIGSSYFIECGDDWELYAHSKLGKLKIRKSLEEYISSTPQIAEDGGIVLGSKKTTAFLVDAKTGRLIYMYKIDDSSSYMQNNEENNVPFNTTIEEQGLPASMNLKTDEMSLYITRTDFVLTSFAPNSNKVLWNVTVAEIGAAFLCPNIEDSGAGVLLNSVSSETGLHFNMPMPCQSRALVYRFRGRNILEPISWPGRLPEAHGQDMTLPESKTNNVLPSQLNVDKVLEFLSSLRNIDRYLEAGQHGDNKVVLPLPSRHESSGMSDREAVEMPQMDKFSRLFEKFSTFHLILFTIIFAVIVRYQCDRMARKKFDINANAKAVPSKRKKIRKSGKNRDFEGEIRNTESESDNNFWTNLNQPTTQFIDGRTIGKLFVSSKEIAKGSNGTIVLEGIYDGRPVAVKRLVRAHHDIAFKEIQNLIASDQHPNIVRWYGVEQDRDFVYLSLERCICSLHDLIQMHSDSIENTTFNKDLGAEAPTEDSVNLVPMHDTILDIKLWKAKGYPSPILLKIMRDVVYGLMHLHELGIIHRDLKPHNVLIIKDRSLCAKLSDMGISKRLVGDDMSSLGHHATGYGSSGWQAPEQLLHGRQTRAVDLFSLGCVLFFCITGGRHPFGNRLERDINIAKNKVDLFLVEHIPEAVDLLSHLLDPKLEMRPKALEVLAHPLFWIADTQLSFLRDTSDRVELEDRETGSELLKALESIAPVALGGKWNEKMEPAFINNIGHYRRYKFDSVRDLLRVMRNKLNHYRELPTEIQKILGPVPEGFDDYFRSRFPKLLIEVYKVMYKYCRKEECFHKYFKSSDYSF